MRFNWFNRFDEGTLEMTWNDLNTNYFHDSAMQYREKDERRFEEIWETLCNLAEEAEDEEAYDRLTEGIVFDARGYEVDYNSAVALMDDDVREEIHMKLAPCTEQEFFESYSARHLEKFGEEFAPYSGGDW